MKKLAEGKSGNFWLAGKHELRVVVKEANSVEIFAQEMDALKQFPSHPNIIKLNHVKLKEPKAPSRTLTFEYAVNGNLRSYLKTKKNDFSDWHLLKLAIDVANGMKKLESCCVVHCDLRAHNILVDGDMNCQVASLNAALCLKHDETHRICPDKPIAI